MQAWLICDHAFQRRYPFGMSKPFPVPTCPVPAVGLPEAGQDPGRTGGQVRHRPDRRWSRPSRSSTGTPAGRGPGVRPRRHAPSTAAPATRSTSPNPSLAPLEQGAVLRDQGAARQLRHVLRAARRRRRPGAGRGRRPVSRAVRAGQRPGERDGRPLPVGWHQHRPGDDVRLHRRARSPECRPTRTSSRSCRTTASERRRSAFLRATRTEHHRASEQRLGRCPQRSGVVPWTARPISPARCAGAGCARPNHSRTGASQALGVRTARTWRPVAGGPPGYATAIRVPSRWSRSTVLVRRTDQAVARHAPAAWSAWRAWLLGVLGLNADVAEPPAAAPHR